MGARRSYRAFHPRCRRAAADRTLSGQRPGERKRAISPKDDAALLIYCYATGRFGSRTIEAAMIIAATTIAAHTAIRMRFELGRRLLCIGRLNGLTKKAEPPPTRDVNRESGTASANGGWLRRLRRLAHIINLASCRSTVPTKSMKTKNPKSRRQLGIVWRRVGDWPCCQV